MSTVVSLLYAAMCGQALCSSFHLLFLLMYSHPCCSPPPLYPPPFCVILTMFRGGRCFRGPTRLSLILKENQMMVYD